MQIAYVNLAGRPDREARMAEQFDRLGLAATRIEAMTSAGIPIGLKRRYCDPLQRFWLTEVELACSLSHVAAYRAIAESGSPYGAIFEDDVVLSASLPAFLAAFDAAAPLLDVVRLEADPAPQRVSPAPPMRIGALALVEVHGWANGAAAYILSRRAALRLIETDYILGRQTDRVLFNPYEPFLREGFAMRHSDPALAIQLDRLPGAAPIASDIAKARSERGTIEKALFPRRLGHDLSEAFDRDIRIGVLKAWHQHVGGARKRLLPFSPD